MRAGTIAAGVALGALLAYFLARQIAPKQLEEIGSTVTDAFENLIAGFEGFRATPYQDDAGIWTIGFGHRIIPGDGYWHPDFAPVGKKSLTVEEARVLYARDTAAAQAAVYDNVAVPLSPSQEAALISLAYNIGANAFRRSTLLKKLNAGDYQGAADQFLVWNKVTVDGALVVSGGLTSRREKEREIFLA